PFSAMATIDGVVLYPPLLGITAGVPSSTIATQELVVPRSMPITLSLAICLPFSPCRPCRRQYLCTGISTGSPGRAGYHSCLSNSPPWRTADPLRTRAAARSSRRLCELCPDLGQIGG